MTRDELLIYEKACGTESAINLLLLGGADHYTGDYDQTMAELEARREEAQNEVGKGYQANRVGIGKGI